MSGNRVDASMVLTTALPNGAATTASAGTQLKQTTKGDFVAPMEFKIDLPALGATPLPDAKTMIVAAYHDDAAGFGTETLLADRIVVQTGAGGIGSVAKSARFRPPTDAKTYIRFKATGSASGDASGSNFTVTPVF